MGGAIDEYHMGGVIDEYHMRDVIDEVSYAWGHRRVLYGVIAMETNVQINSSTTSSEQSNSPTGSGEHLQRKPLMARGETVTENDYVQITDWNLQTENKNDFLTFSQNLKMSSSPVLSVPR
ncbi:hypothetical protein Btru_027196 [Bulinus truncatus]|nr:hypothetical protein Btru_027196 [Bulinus truncatus]